MRMDSELPSIVKTKERERSVLAIGQKDLSYFQDPEILGQLLGGTGRAKMVWGCLKQGIDPCSDQGIESSKTKLVLSTCFEGLPTVSKQTVAACGTIKLLLDLKDGLQVCNEKNVYVVKTLKPLRPNRSKRSLFHTTGGRQLREL